MRNTALKEQEEKVAASGRPRAESVQVLATSEWEHKLAGFFAGHAEAL